jgi:hypothetical protein
MPRADFYAHKSAETPLHPFSVRINLYKKAPDNIRRAIITGIKTAKRTYPGFDYSYRESFGEYNRHK